MYLKQNISDVAAETFDAETILVNFATGFYFSFGGVGPLVWDCFAEAVDAEQVKDLLAAHFGEPVQNISADLSDFIAELRKQGLLVAAEANDASDSTLHEIVRAAATEYTVPTVAVFKDLAELVLLDPIHEVDEQQGWPIAAPTR